MLKNIYLLIAGALTCLYGYSQESEKIVQINNYTVNLDTVPLDKGIVLEKGTTIRKDKWGEKSCTFEIKLLSCMSKNNYAVVYDSTTNYEGGYYNRIIFFDADGEILFNKYFPNLIISSCYISSSGEIVVLELSNEDFAEVQVYSHNGSLLSSYKNHYEKYYTGEKHNYFFKMKGADINNKYDLIDKSGNIREIEFPSGRVLGIEFSKNELYYIVHIDRNQLLYNMNQELIWKIPTSFGNINFFDNNDETSVSVSRHSRILEVRNLLTQKVLCSVNSIDYNGEQLKIDYYNVFDEYFYLVANVNGKWLFAFYNSSCEFIYSKFVDRKTSPSKYKVIRNEDKFEIIEK